MAFLLIKVETCSRSWPRTKVFLMSKDSKSESGKEIISFPQILVKSFEVLLKNRFDWPAAKTTAQTFDKGIKTLWLKSLRVKTDKICPKLAQAVKKASRQNL